jgi:hypothetical protein
MRPASGATSPPQSGRHDASNTVARRPARKRWEWPPQKHRFQPVTFSSETGDFRVRRPAREDLISIWPAVAAMFALGGSILLLSRTVAARNGRDGNGMACALGRAHLPDAAK